MIQVVKNDTNSKKKSDKCEVWLSVSKKQTFRGWAKKTDYSSVGVVSFVSRETLLSSCPDDLSSDTECEVLAALCLQPLTDGAL